jgi:methionyl-tRNA formyltransferase
MRLIFAGTPTFAEVALNTLIAHGHEVVLVLTQPDRPSGRGLRLQASEVKQAAQQHGIAVQQPQGLRLDGRFADDAATARQALQHAVDTLGAQAMVVAAYGLLLPQWVLRLPPLGCINIHASLLPRWRGAAPIHRAIEAGDAETGISIMQMDEGLDTGAVYKTGAIPIAAHETTGSLHDQLADLGAQLCHQVLQALSRREITATAQAAEGVSYAAKINKAEGQIKWHEPATTIARKIRAFNPTPGTWSSWAGELVKFWQAEPLGPNLAPIGDLASSTPGTVLAVAPEAVTIATGHGLLRVTQMQRAGGKRLPMAELLRGMPLQIGDRFT